MKSTETDFGTVAKTIHWASALLVIVLIVTGFRAGFSEDVATKAAALRIHLPVAILTLFLTLGRLIWWWRFDRKPDPVPGSPAWQEAIAQWTHRALYLLLLIMLASGVGLSVLSGLPDALFGAADFPDLAAYPPRAGHGIGARVIVVLVALHAGAALFHHVIVKDRTLRRMWFGSKG